MPLAPLPDCALLFEYGLNSAKSTEKLDRKVAQRRDSVAGAEQNAGLRRSRFARTEEGPLSLLLNSLRTSCFA